MKKTFICIAVLAVLFSSLMSPALAISVVPFKDSTAASVADKTTIKAAIKEFKSLSRAERKARIKDAKIYAKDHKNDMKSDSSGGTSMFWLIVFSILLPPLAVYLKEGSVTSHFWISLLLTLLFWIPGVIYALIIVTKK